MPEENWGLNLPDEKLRPQQTAKEDLVLQCEDYIEDTINNEPFILLQPRASSPVRTPRPDFWKNVINKLTSRGHRVIITDSPHMSEYLDEFISKLDNPENITNFSKYSKSLDYSIALATLSKLVLATDSSFLHIASS